MTGVTCWIPITGVLRCSRLLASGNLPKSEQGWALWSGLPQRPSWPIAACSGGELPGSLQRIAGPHPEPFEPAQRHSDALQVRVRDLGLAQHLDVPFVHGAEP